MDVATSIKIYRKTMNGLLRQIEQSLRDEQKEGCYALVKLRSDIRSLAPALDDADRYKLDVIENSMHMLEEMVLGFNGMATLHGMDLRTFVDEFAANFESHLNQAFQATQHPINDPAVRAAVYALTGGRCAYCDCELEQGTGTTEAFTIEHIVPRESGGPDNIANYVPACKSCNCSKGTSHVVTFIKRRVLSAAAARSELRLVPNEANGG